MSSQGNIKHQCMRSSQYNEPYTYLNMSKKNNQSIENAGVAFVKGGQGQELIFEKINTNILV